MKMEMIINNAMKMVVRYLPLYAKFKRNTPRVYYIVDVIIKTSPYPVKAI